MANRNRAAIARYASLVANLSVFILKMAKRAGWTGCKPGNVIEKPMHMDALKSALEKLPLSQVPQIANHH